MPQNSLHAMWEKANAFDIDHIAAHHAAEHKLDIEEVRSWIPELKKWLVMVAYKPENDYVIFGPVDALWHTFICFTREYARFCDEVSGTFIHHVPAEKIFQIEEKSGQVVETGIFQMPREIKTVRKSQIAGYRRMLEDYINILGTTVIPDFNPNDYPPFASIWPRIIDDGYIDCQSTSCCGGGGCGCIQTRP